MPIAVELRTTCERCKDPLPLNAWGTRVTCWACLHENPVSPEEWAALLGGALEEAWSYDTGAGLTESRKVGKRTFDVRWTNASRARGPRRKRPREMRRDLFPTVVALAGEERDAPPVPETVAFACPQCAGALAIDGHSREVTCAFCNATSLLGDELWRRLHPVHAQKRWYLVLEDDEDADAPADEHEAPAQGAPRRAAAAARAAGEPTTPRFAVGIEGDVTVGPDGLLYAAGTFGGTRPALWCMDADLRVRWRVDVKRSTLGPVRVAVVGEEVWYADAQRHALRRFARADGADRGKLGGPEPENARAHHLDVRGLNELVACPDGTVLALLLNRIVRYDAAGNGILSWPAKTGFWSLFSKESLAPLYTGPAPKGGGAGMFVERPHADATSDDLGSDRPRSTFTLTTRAVVAPDGDFWTWNGTKVHRYGRDGTCRWTTALEGVADGLPMRPGVDADGNLYVLTTDEKGRVVLFRLTPAGAATQIARGAMGTPIAFVVVGDRLILFGSDTGDVRVFDRDGKPVRASAVAVAADRDAQADEDEDDEEVDEALG